MNARQTADETADDTVDETTDQTTDDTTAEAARPDIRIGWAGTGRMGFALATRLLDAGHPLAVFNRTRAKAEPLAARGAVLADGPADLAACDVVFTMVSGSSDFAEITIGEHGLLTGKTAPRVLVDCSTVDAEVSAQVRAVAESTGTVLLAAPVSGNPRVVASGGASFAVSGPEEAYRTVEPLLEHLGASVTYVGEGEAARLVKICHNVLLGVLAQSLAEITLLAEKHGVRRAAFLEFLNASVLGSPFTRYKAPALVHLDFTPTFTTTLLRKDLDLGLAAARRAEVPMPIAAAVHQLVQAAVGAGHGDQDFAALLLEQARASGMVLTPEDVSVDDGLGPRPVSPQ
ncbi:3-hydroxyisobutyrate dehydrogenase [Streptacidiphilus sp. MAP12-16]|uniref:NAD(P)-dependent oxidoreductase n=1 Tax=Streptacidiphilus sp. MAP12-16 TaxID=3156300 RepID=UPI003513F7E0